MTGRALNADERDRAAKKKIGFSEVTLLMDGVAIIVNESNPVKASVAGSVGKCVQRRNHQLESNRWV